MPDLGRVPGCDFGRGPGSGFKMNPVYNSALNLVVRGPWMWFKGLIGFADISITIAMMEMQFWLFIATFLREGSVTFVMMY